MDNGYTLCVLCCCSFNADNLTTATICRQDLLNFFKILVESPPQFTPHAGGSVADLQSVLDSSGLSICSDCHAFISVASDTRLRAEQVERSVRNLQMQILEQLRALQSEMDLFHQEMTKIESVVKTSDESCLMFHIPTHGQVDNGRDNGIMVLRERILDVVTDFRIYQVSCSTDTNLPVDESEMEAMWEDAQQLVQCTPDVTVKYEEHYGTDGFCDSSGRGEQHGGGDGEDEATLYMGHSVGANFYIEGESEPSDSEDGIKGPAFSPVPGGRLNKSFKEDVIRRALAREQSRTPDQNQSTDPLRRYYLKYDVKRAKLSVGPVEIIINEADETLQCSQCSIMGKRSKSNHQSKQNWRDMEKGVLVHIIGKHLGGFVCTHCNFMFTSHTMIKKHVSKEHSGQTLSSVAVATPPPSLSIPPSPVVATEKHSKPKPYACSMCSSAFSKPSELKRHFIAKHAIVVQPPPPIGKSSEMKQGHAASSFPAVGAGSTAAAEKVIPAKSAQRPHECHICKYAFTKGSHLKRHLEVHRKRNELV